MRCYKILFDGYILAIGEGEYGGMTISKEEYNHIFSIIRNKPFTTETTDYRLREDLTWEAIAVDPLDLNLDQEPTLEDKAEAYDILTGVIL